MDNSITVSSKSRSFAETIMYIIFLVCGFTAAVSVILITIYMLISGAPAITKIGVFDFLFGQVWNPQNSQFGILAIILSSLLGTACAILIAVPMGVCVAVFLAHIANKKITGILSTLIELLAGIPSVVYGLLGAILIVPALFKIQKQFNLPQSDSLAAAIIVLVIMILPTIISVSKNAIEAVPKQYHDASLALGSSKMQSIVKVIIPSAKSGIVAGIVLGVGRAIGETMAVLMVAGNAVIMPELLKPARLLTVGISLEWAYSSGTHREALSGIGLVLFIFIMIVNILLSTILKKGGKQK